MAQIRANRESIDDRFSVLGFTIRSEDPLYEIGLATDPDLLRADNRAKRTAGNFCSSGVLATTARRGDSVYLVPPSIVARFVGQSRLYFGLATYKEGDRSHPASVRIPDRGNMYVSLSGLTERGLRRTARYDRGNGYGGNGSALTWGGDDAAAPAAATNGTSPAAKRANGNGAAAPAASAPSEPAPYSDGYSDDLWKAAPAAAPAPSTGNGNAASPSPVAAAPTPAPAATNGAAAPATTQSYIPRTAPARSRTLLVSPYYQPTNWFDALTSQISFFVSSAMWYLGVVDTTVPPHSAICQVRRPDGTDEGALHGSAFFIGPRLLLTAAHVVAGQDELIIVPGKNGAGISSATEPFGRFRVSSSAFRQHPSYGTNGHDYDMAVICVPAANAVASPNYFDLVEELTECRQEGVVVCGYAARWYATDAIEKFVNDTIDPNKQHMMGGHIRTLPSDETFDYDLQTLGGTSGSPVYWIEEGATPRAHMVGVHVAAHSATTNLGCRMTAAKRQWITETAAGLGVAFSLGARSLGYNARALDDYADDPDAYGITGPIPDDGAIPTAQALRARSLDVLTPEYPGASRFAIAHSSNFHVASQPRSIDHIVIHTTDGAGRTNGTIAWFQNGDQRDMKNRPIHVSSHYIVGRDGEVVQCVRNNDIAHHASAANSHTIGIEHETSTKLKLDPNEPEYAASSWLVAWLCSQFSVPIDRDHIKGHQEISPQDNHDCPGRAWNWDHYMDCVRAAAYAIAQGVDVASASAAAVATTVAPQAQSLAVVRRGFARAQEIITPYYDPADPMSALTCQNDAFSLAREEWFMGVPNTKIFPHSAICALEMTDSAGNVWGGTGFYVGPNRILTCAHNLYKRVSVTVIPGKNSAEEPFGRCTLAPSSWRVAPRYTGSGNWDNDLAVIDNVPIAAPNGQYFEFLNATPSDQMQLVVCGYSGASDAVPELTNAIDGDKQHLHGGRGAQQPDNLEVIDYPLLTLHGASGSPVYQVTGDGGALKAKVCAVHVTGQPAAQGMNRGCFLTPNKLDWIEGRATTFALTQSRAAMTRRPTPMSLRSAVLGNVASNRPKGKPLASGQGLFDLLPVDIKIRVFIPAPVAIVTIPVTGGVMPGQSAHGGDGRTFQQNGGTSRAEVTGRFRFGADGQPSQLTDVTRTFGESTNWSIDDTVVAPGMPEWYRNLKPGAKPTERGTQSVTDSKLNLELGGSSFHGMISMAENAVVVTFNLHASDPIVTGAPDIDATIALLIRMEGDRVKVRVNGGHDEFPAYEIYANSTLVYSYDPVAAGGTPWGLFGDGNWDVNPDTSYVDVGPATEYHIVGPVRIKDTPTTSQSLGIGSYRTRAFDDGTAPVGADAPPAAASPPTYPVTLIPQPDKNACWAASMAMLLSYRRNASFSPETLANEVGRSLASSYSWDLLSAVRDRYGFTAITQPSNTSLYHTPQQWADWLAQYGPLWVVIVGAPHAVVVAAIRGNLADPNATQVRILNPWDTRITFDNDPVAFNPPNAGYEDWLPFAQFAGDFGNMAQPDYGNWRVLYLPASATVAQSLGARQIRLKPTPRAKSLEDVPTSPRTTITEPIEPTRVAGTRMSTAHSSTGASKWALDQLEGFKSPTAPAANVSPSQTSDVTIELGAWPAIEGQDSPLPLTVNFRSTQQGAVGDVSITAGTPPNLGYGVEVVARIDNEADVDGVAALKVGIDYRFSGFAQGGPAARIELRLLGDGRWERVNRWVSTAAAA